MKIIFIYNANSGLVNSILDFGHKVISPKTYECNLCSMTFGVLTEREEWKKFRETANKELEFLHKDEFEKKYKEKRDYPVILKLNEKEVLDELLNRNDLNKMTKISQLIQKLEKVL